MPQRRSLKSFPQLKSVTVMVSIKGVRRPRRLDTRDALRRRGNSKGGLVAASRGTSHKWTSEEARKAALKSWRKKGRWHKRSGPNQGEPMIRLGRRLAKAAPVDRVQIRARHSTPLAYGIHYNATLGVWMRADPLTGGHVISERHALRTLGYLRPKTKLIPEAFGKLVEGTRLAEMLRRQQEDAVMRQKVYETLGDGCYWTSIAIARRIEAPVSSVRRCLQELIREGTVKRDGIGRFIKV